MKYLKNRNIFYLLFLANICLGQNSSNISSNLKDFEGIWLFIPPEWSNDTSFFAFDFFYKSNRLTLYYRKNKVTVHCLGPDIIGFAPKQKEINKLSDLADIGTRMYFFTPNPNAPNDSLKYFEEASPSCLAMYNGIAGEEEFSPPSVGKPNYFTFNFNGRENEFHRQTHHLPNQIVKALCDNNVERAKVEAFLKIKYALIKSIKPILFIEPSLPSKMYLFKNDPVEVVEEKNGWLKIKYYPEKNGQWTGKTIEGWIKKSDVGY